MYAIRKNGKWLLRILIDGKPEEFVGEWDDVVRLARLANEQNKRGQKYE